MVSFFIVTLGISIVGIIMLLLVKQIELSTGSVLFAGARPKVNRFFKTCLVMVERVIPGLAHEGFMQILKRLRVAAQVTLAHAALKVEQWLKRVLHTIRHKLHTEPSRGEASAFLKEVGEYKKQLESEAKEEAQNF